MKSARHESGFTLPELLIAGSMTMFLTLVAWELLLHGAETMSEADARARLNHNARLAFEVLENGGTGKNLGTDGTDQVRGVRTAEDLPAGPFRSASQLTLSGNGLQILGDTLAAVSVGCKGLGDPLPDCAVGGETLVVEGWVASDPDMNANVRSVAGRTVEMGFVLADPRQVRRQHGRNGSAIEDYRKIMLRLNEGRSE